MAAATRKLFYLLALLAAACPLRAEIYKWIDADGAVHYTDTSPPAQQQTLDITGHISSYDSPEILPANSAENAAAKTSTPGTKSAENKRVVMYSAEWCGVCKRAKKHFAKKNIAYTEYDIDKNAKAKAEFDKIGGRGVPVILIGDRRMNGFSESGFEQLYYKQ